MKEFEGKPCKIMVEVDGVRLNYNALIVTSVTSSHITFIDKYRDAWCYRISDVVEIQGVKKE